MYMYSFIYVWWVIESMYLVTNVWSARITGILYLGININLIAFNPIPTGIKSESFGLQVRNSAIRAISNPTCQSGHRKYFAYTQFNTAEILLKRMLNWMTVQTEAHTYIVDTHKRIQLGLLCLNSSNPEIWLIRQFFRKMKI